MSPLARIMSCSQTIFKGFWKWHIENIALMSEALLRTKTVGIASLGREIICNTTPKHAIKRVDKFLRNSKLPLHEMVVGYIRWVIGPRKKIGISCDWTKIRDWPVLVASMVYKGRSIPLLWAVMDENQLYKSINHFEHAFFILLKESLPKHLDEVVLLMDRGFKRVKLLKQLENLGFKYVVRTGGNIKITHSMYHGPLQNLISKRGEYKDLKGAVLRQDKCFTARIVGQWEAGQKESWLLVTNLQNCTPRMIAIWYGKRFQIEETFRDQKSHRFGFALGNLKLYQAQRLERLLLIVVFAQFIATLVGINARILGLDRQFRANTGRQKTEHSDFFLGRYYTFRIQWQSMQLITYLYQSFQELGG